MSQISTSNLGGNRKLPFAFTKDENPYSSSDYVTKDEFNKVIQALMAAIPSSQPQPAQEEAPP